MTYRLAAKATFITLFFYVAIIFRLSFFWKEYKVEAGVYVAYAESLAFDGDLNIINNIPKEMGWLVSTNYHFPDMHDYGISILWAPYLSFLKYFFPDTIRTHFKNNPNTPIDQFIFLLLSMAMLIVAYTLIDHLFESYLKRKISRLSFLYIFFGSGLFYWTYLNTTGTEPALFLFSALVMLLSFQVTPIPSHLFFLGSILGFIRTIKVHALTLSVLSLVILVATKKIKKNEYKKMISMFMGFGLFYALNEINNFERYGFFNLGQGYLQEVTAWKPSFFIDLLKTLFGPAGHFTTSPLLAITLVAGGILMIKRPEAVGIALLGSIACKIIFFSFATTPGTIEFGSRNYIIDTIAIFYVFAIIYEGSLNRLKHGKLIIHVGMIVVIAFQFLSYHWYHAILSLPFDQRLSLPDFDLTLFRKFLSSQGEHIKIILKDEVFNISSFGVAKKFILVCSFGLAMLTIFKKRVLSVICREKFLGWFAICLILAFTTTTFLNIFVGRGNSKEMMQRGFFENKTIGSGVYIFTIDNITTDMIPAIEADKSEGRTESFKRRTEFYKKMLSLAASEIKRDGSGYIKKLEQGMIPVGLEGMEIPVSVLDEKSPARF